MNQFDVETEDKQIITYIKRNANSEYLQIIRETIEPKITLRSCALYLYSHFPYRKFSTEQIQKCYIIFNLLIHKANLLEFLNNDMIPDVGYQGCSVLLSDFTYSCSHFGMMYRYDKSYYSKNILFNYSLRIVCHEIEHRSNPKFIWTIDQILDDETKYAYCINFWSNIITHQDIRNVLLTWFPDDIIDKIFSCIKC